jgi:hypothetical protein
MGELGEERSSGIRGWLGPKATLGRKEFVKQGSGQIVHNFPCDYPLRLSSLRTGRPALSGPTVFSITYRGRLFVSM